MVVGGGDSAVKEALHLAGFADRLFLVHRRDRLRAEPILVEKLLSCGKCRVYWNSSLKEIVGVDSVEGVLLETPEGPVRVPVDGVFMYVGRTPATGPFQDLIELNKDGSVMTHDTVHTSAENVFAAGDVTDNELRQVVTAVSDGARAAAAAFDLLQRDGKEEG
jgi:thioredoxin reductase (NADPH)